MKCKYLIDSVIFIEHLKGLTAATEWLLLLNEEEAAISVISYAEVIVGISPKEEEDFYSLIDHYLRLKIDFPIANLAAEFRRKYRWKLPDAFQAALACENKLLLATRNTKDFSPQRHPFVKIPY